MMFSRRIAIGMLRGRKWQKQQILGTHNSSDKPTGGPTEAQLVYIRFTSKYHTCYRMLL